jgi:ADP-ribose pyrophosphatase
VNTPTPQTLHKGRFLELACIGNWEFARRPGTTNPVGILAVTPENKILLISQFRIPVQKVVIEIPAGLIGDCATDENWETAARRELEEETGYTAEHFEKLTQGPTSAGLTSECSLLVRAIGVKKKGDQHLDGDEQITVHEIAITEAHEWVRARERAGDLVDPKVWVSLYFAGCSSSDARR